jgi:hypothetical protein
MRQETRSQTNTPGQVEKSAMSTQELLEQINLIQHVMKSVMREGEHYGVIPGTDKPTLLQPGAEKLLLTFRLGTEFAILDAVRDKDFISYTVRCDLFHIPTGSRVAAGIGSCNSRETRYRYRLQDTGRPVPREYWESRDPALLGGAGFKPAKKGGRWTILERVESASPWDHDNTILKMAAKRAKVAATINATAASDIFTQDMEDLGAPELPAEANGGASPAECAAPLSSLHGEEVHRCEARRMQGQP